MNTTGAQAGERAHAPAALLGDPLLAPLRERGVAASLDAAAGRAAERLGLPFGLVTLLDGDRQHVVGAAGLAPSGPLSAESAAGWRFCLNAARRRGPFISSNTIRDPRLALDPSVRVEGLRCFVAVPLSVTGRPFPGALAVAGPEPHRVTDTAVDELRELAALTVLELRRDHGLV